MLTITDVFGDDLQPDPTVALKPVQVPVRKKSGPMHRLQFVVEFIGPRSVPAAAAAAILNPQWHVALGRPQGWAMSPGDVDWQPLTTAVTGSYDSLALAWDLVSDQGELTAAAAQYLLTACEHFAEHLNRRAMPLPIPSDVPQALKQVHQIAENFDAGVTFMALAASGQVSEYELWIYCAKLGLVFSPGGTFDWRVPGSDLPLFSVTPLGNHEAFSLAAAKRGDQHEGVLIGFNIPRCPEPVAALDGALISADVLAGRMHGQVFDESGHPLTPSAKQELHATMRQVVDTMTSIGFAPGSPEALKLFS